MSVSVVDVVTENGLGSELFKYVVGAVIVSAGSVRSIAHVWLAGLGSVSVAAFVARTSNVWLPSGRAVSVCGVEQDVHDPPSILQVKVTGDWLELNVNVGVESFDGSGGVVSMVVSGAICSIVHVYVAGVGSVLSAVSVARTSKV
jgi:hypothetical protein